MEEQALQPYTPSSNITKSSTTLQKRLEQTEAEIIQFINLPLDSPSLESLARNIENKLAFIRNLLNAEIASHGMMLNDSSEFEGKIKELKAKFYGSNTQSVDSETGSVCGSCLNDDSDDEMSDFEGAEELLYEVVVQDIDDEKVDECKMWWWWKMVVVLTMVSGGLMVSYLGKNQRDHQQFLTPT